MEPNDDRFHHLPVIAAILRHAGFSVRIEGDFVGCYLFSRPVTAAEIAAALDRDGIDEGMVECKQRGRWVAVVVL